MFDNFFTKREIIVFRILFVKNAVLFFVQTDTAEKVGRRTAKRRIFDVAASRPAFKAKFEIGALLSANQRLVHFRRTLSPERVIPAIGRRRRQKLRVGDIFAFMNRISDSHVFGAFYMLARGIRGVDCKRETDGIFQP